MENSQIEENGRESCPECNHYPCKCAEIEQYWDSVFEELNRNMELAELYRPESENVI